MFFWLLGTDLAPKVEKTPFFCPKCRFSGVLDTGMIVSGRCRQFWGVVFREYPSYSDIFQRQTRVSRDVSRFCFGLGQTCDFVQVNFYTGDCLNLDMLCTMKGKRTGKTSLSAYDGHNPQVNFLFCLRNFDEAVRADTQILNLL